MLHLHLQMHLGSYLLLMCIVPRLSTDWQRTIRLPNSGVSRTVAMRTKFPPGQGNLKKIANIRITNMSGVFLCEYMCIITEINKSYKVSQIFMSLWRHFRSLWEHYKLISNSHSYRSSWTHISTKSRQTSCHSLMDMLRRNLFWWTEKYHEKSECKWRLSVALSR
jgi:hypothetical protein